MTTTELQISDRIVTDGEYGGRDVRDEWRVADVYERSSGAKAYELVRLSDGKRAMLEGLGGLHASISRGSGRSFRTLRKFVTVERVVRVDR